MLQYLLAKCYVEIFQQLLINRSQFEKLWIDSF